MLLGVACRTVHRLDYLVLLMLLVSLLSVFYHDNNKVV